MKLSAKNGLKCYVDKKLKTDLDMHYNSDKCEIVFYLSDVTAHLKEKIKSIALDYVSKNDLYQAYGTITVYS